MHKLTTYLKVISHSRDHQRLFLNVNEIMRLQKTLSRNLPPQLAKRCCISNCVNGILVIKAANSVVASKLKQMTPSLLKVFENHIGTIQIAVDTQSYREDLYNNNAKNPQKPALSLAGIQTLQQLEMMLTASPLKSAIHSLLNQHQLSDNTENH